MHHTQIECVLLVSMDTMDTIGLEEEREEGIGEEDGEVATTMAAEAEAQVDRPKAD